MFGSDDSAAKRARVAKQLRDKNGRWIEMGGLVKWFDNVDGKEQSGIVTDILDDGRAVIDRTDRPGGYVARVKGQLLEAIDEKATLDAPGTPKADVPASIPTKTVKAAKQTKVGGFNINVSTGLTTIEKPDGYGNGNVIALSHANMDKISDAVKAGEKGSVDLGGGTTAHIAANTIGFRSQAINPNDGTPGPLNMLVTTKDEFADIFEASKQPLEDKEIPDYSKVPKKEPEPAKAPYVPTKPVLAPRHKLFDGGSKIEITDKKVSIFTEDGYGTGDSVSMTKENFKKVIEAASKGEKAEIGGETVTFKEDGSVNFYSRYVNPNDGSFGPATSVTISKKAFDDIKNTIDEPLPDAAAASTLSWSSTFELSAAELAIDTVLSSESGTVLKKISDNSWEYKSNSGVLTFTNNSIDGLKSIDSVFFRVELS